MDAVSFVNNLLAEAIAQGASDIHFESYENSYRIRYRQDGILYQKATPPLASSQRITARLKILANLDISEKRIPQDGGFSMQLPDKSWRDFRVSTCPVLGGEKVVLRILDSSSTRLGIGALGFSDNQYQSFIKAIKQPQGMILVTGPTGSGKTQTLYTALDFLNTMEVNICTVEDPIEIKVPGINQVPVNIKAGLTFPNVLRAFLRQDPDIIMIGEIRDHETASIAIKAAQTGHLVLSTLHTNNALDSLDRLLQLGIPEYTLANTLTLVIAQRLLRQLCKHCKRRLPETGFLTAQSCDQCVQGYKGRTAVFEVLPLSPAMSGLITSGASGKERKALAESEGILSLWESGMTLVKSGVTSLEEMKRVIMD